MVILERMIVRQLRLPDQSGAVEEGQPSCRVGQSLVEIEESDSRLKVSANGSLPWLLASLSALL